MESMTGYAVTEKKTDQFSIAVEIKSLNSKYMEVNINLPRSLRNMEKMFDEILKESFSRGKIEVFVELTKWKNRAPLSLNHEAIEAYYHELTLVCRKLGISDELKLESILHFDGITQKNNSFIFEEYHQIILTVLRDAIKRTIAMRLKEGVSIRSDINKSLKEIGKKVIAIKMLSKKLKKDKIGKLDQKIRSILKNRIDDSRIYSEIAILGEKLDINEEIVRLNDHLKKFRSIMDSEVQAGRKLDFLSQEIFREINTIASKSNSSEISQLTVYVKDYIDKIREQCRNIV